LGCSSLEPNATTFDVVGEFNTDGLPQMPISGTLDITAGLVTDADITVAMTPFTPFTDVGPTIAYPTISILYLTDSNGDTLYFYFFNNNGTLDGYDGSIFYDGQALVANEGVDCEGGPYPCLHGGVGSLAPLLCQQLFRSLSAASG